MNILKTICIFAIGMIVMSSGCEKSETVSPDPNQCYEGTVIAVDCPSIIMVQVTNAEIGTKWLWNGTSSFDNAISIFNKPDGLNLQKGDKVYFTIDLESSKNPMDCLKEYPCPTVILFDSYPSKRFCIKSISTQNCSEIDEN